MKALLASSLAVFACLASMQVLSGAAAPASAPAGRKMPELTVDATPIGSESRLVTSYADALEPVQKSVVSVKSSRTLKLRQNLPPPLQKMLPPEDPTEKGLGSGVLLSADGYILTNSHVVEGADELTVTLSNGREMKATLVGADPQTDIAIIKVEAEGLTPITLADSDKLRVGDVVFAIGNPLDVGQTVTMGIVSAKGRTIGILEETKKGRGYEDFIQTDAAINMGNSGGALVDAKGRLVGINSAILTPTQGSIGIGFAVPVNLATGIMKSLVETGSVTRGYLGIDPVPLTDDLAVTLALKDSRGLVITSVTPESPAAKAGLKVYDVVIAFDGRDVATYDDLRLRVAQKPPGSTASLKFMREGKEQSVDVTIVAVPVLGQHDLLAGVSVAPVTATLRTMHMIDASVVEGLVVTEVSPSSPHRSKIAIGAVILDINQQKVTDLVSARKALGLSAVRAPGVRVASMRINTRGTTELKTFEVE